MGGCSFGTAIADLWKLCQPGDLDMIDLVAVVKYANLWTKPHILTVVNKLAIHSKA